MKIFYTDHLKKRLVERKIPKSYPKQIFKSSDNKYFDPATNHMIATKTLNYQGEPRLWVIAYDIIDPMIHIITIHLTTEQEINNKLERGRWIKYEEK